ncbi:MAG: Uma2 family endonuclease [Jaaginema sp. PMC 1079.18]|nr:Uma2 family endonuclease [Jaaginema sp. PMC 1080.18]MEC4849998.1 Uma2 family endonuclease [Jaaginema sp. PMC 1079.18]MEC4866486.1 Uma2 family endonuclease [Jaaginema sp. PMC 1078.18]
MIAIPENKPLTPQQYFEWEAKQALRYEYFDGNVFAMTGGSLSHGRIGLNVSSLLKSHLQSQDRKCLTFNSDCKVGISEAGPFTYPDTSVSCDERDRTATEFIQFPCLIVEVLSPSTEAYDRGKKFELYRQLESLQEYVLLGSETKTVEVFRREANRFWSFIAYAEGDEVEFASVSLTISIDTIYEDVIITPSQNPKSAS